MTWRLVLLYLLGAMGLTIVISLSLIASRLRAVYPPLLGCSLCTGFWVGMLSGSALAAQGELLWRHLLPFAFASALLSYLVGTWLREHDRKHE